MCILQDFIGLIYRPFASSLKCVHIYDHFVFFCSTVANKQTVVNFQEFSLIKLQDEKFKMNLPEGLKSVFGSVTILTRLPCSFLKDCLLGCSSNN